MKKLKSVGYVLDEKTLDIIPLIPNKKGIRKLDKSLSENLFEGGKKEFWEGLSERDKIKIKKVISRKKVKHLLNMGVNIKIS